MLSIFNTRLILVLVFSTILIMSAFGGARYYLIKKSFEKNVDSLVEQAAGRVTSVVKPSIWTLYSKSKSVERSFSEEFASGVLDSELAGDYIFGLIVYGQFGHIYMGKWKGVDGKIISYEKSQRQTLLKYSDSLRSYPISFETMTLGRVELFIHTTELNKGLNKALVFDLVQIGIISRFFVFVLFYMIRRALLEPVHKLEVAHKAFESMAEAIVFTDNNGVIYDFNNAFADMANLLPKNTANKNIHTFFPDISDKVKHLSESDNESWQGEVDFHFGSSQTIPTLLTVSLENTTSGYHHRNSGLVFVFQNISSQKNTEKTLQKLAFYDALTGQPNRQYFEEELTANLRLAERESKKLFLFFIDLDNFKHINDVLGHSAGDKVLVEVARRIKMRLRGSDFFSRIGGDEFTIIINCEINSDKVAELASQLIKIVSEPIIISDSEFKVGASIGIATYPDDALNTQNLIKNADIAMYNAKELGKNQFSFFCNDMNENVEQYFELRNSIDLAIKNNEFRLYYQPKVDLLNNTVHAAEALIRWVKPNGDLISPGKFIPLAEDTHQIIPIGRWVIETAINQLKQWERTKFSKLSLSINVSPIQLYSDDFITHLKDTLLKFAINPKQLEIEITESAIIRDAEKAVSVLHELKKLGVKLSLDDFGTGYSSLSYLQLLPVDILKIDRSFISSAKVENTSGKILISIIKLAKDLNIDVVAEGIEDEEHLELLKTHNCRFGQGYFFSRPVPIEQFEDFEIKL